ncbi:hypothetical protein CK056_23460 [Salmonella enterica subsp. enterica serovar Typhimurium]|uniref:Uncharacterized protein n=1 Tax=Salmonella typhimurium TaxID=90371 RepID=A0A701G1G2_SALTM|nr:hypothetical protein [Salmonella enterica subsp. enterica serovar Typhimurium]HAC6123735.1 hypothetical protein [Salmonella enterica subsp. enterica serovar Typhimurium]
MFCDHRQFAHVTKQRDKMCFWSTAGTPMTHSWSGSARHPYVCYLFASLLLSICYHRGLPGLRLLSFCYFFAIKMLPLPSCNK